MQPHTNNVKGGVLCKGSKYGLSALSIIIK